MPQDDFSNPDYLAQFEGQVLIPVETAVEAIKKAVEDALREAMPSFMEIEAGEKYDDDAENKWVSVEDIELKTWPEFFQKIKSGEKTFELRKDDRNFQVGNILLLKEFIPSGYSAVNPHELKGNYTGEEIRVEVIYIFKGLADGIPFGLSNDYCIMSIKPIGNLYHPHQNK